MAANNLIMPITDLQSGWNSFIQSNTLENSKIRSLVASSWERCRRYNLDPFKDSQSNIQGAELKQRLYNKQHLIKIAQPFMKTIYNFVQGSGFQVVLADEDGYILEVIGDPAILDRAKMVQLIPGGNWNEQIKGTNAIGTALIEEAPVQIYAMEHYLKDNHFLTCSAAPIFDQDGRLCSILDVSGHYQSANPHTLGMVVAAVTAIENQLRLRKATNSLYFAYKYSNTIMESMAEGLISVDNNGVITRINSMGSKILEVKPEECIGKSVAAVFNSSLPMLDVANSGPSYNDKEVALVVHGKEKRFISSATPLINEAGNTIGAVAILREPKTLKNTSKTIQGNRARYTFKDIIGESKPIQEAVKLAQKSAHTISPVLLQGESGTGKELFAQAIHNYGPTKDKPFVALNCAAIPKELIESELFGYEAGSFTGAKKGGHQGKFEIADGGTIFLDEIGDMPLETQAKLLRVLQEKAVTRIGDHQERPVDVRIIAATHRDLSKAITEGKMRLDLYYRINVIPISIPPLRERGSDVVLIVKHFIEMLGIKMKKPIVTIRPEFFKALKGYSWPGNIRELENILNLAIMLSEEGCLDLDHLPQYIKTTYLQSLSEQTKTWQTFDSEVLSLKDAEKQAIMNALKACSGNITQTAQKLGVGRNTLYRKLKEYQISVPF